MNFKGGSGKTTTAAHMAQYLALRGYRVLAIDLDPQASLSTLFGVQPETLDAGESLYGAIRYADPRPMGEIISATYIPDLHLIQGNLELMEFEHETPKALVDGRSADRMFFARVAQALAAGESDAGGIAAVDHRAGARDGDRSANTPKPNLHKTSSPATAPAGVFLEVLQAAQRLIVVGAGEDAKPLVNFASLLGWQVLVFDGRPQFAKPERFPSASHVEVLPPNRFSEIGVRPADA